MTQENIFSSDPGEPLPLSNDIQEVTEFEDGGWKAVIEYPESGSGDCVDNHKFCGLVAGINEQRRRALFRRMGIR
jgi:hypothetical protein